jgi:hypothetical protein
VEEENKNKNIAKTRRKNADIFALPLLGSRCRRALPSLYS